MFKLLALSLLFVSALAQNLPDNYPFSVPVGSGSGTGFVTSGEGRITAVRVWELNNNQITGFQLRFDYVWGPIIGRSSNDRVDMTLFDGETIIQVSGKYNPSSFIELVQFMTNRGRFLSAGQPTGLSFNYYPI
ncbi:hypothetical protein ACEWY4_024023 [Coilia grayii]|uniref:Jacalin-type lectin domain-containing protein n=1 Tax=Coilia grayii TaxID=363190 RepID=A0ABD1J148_9TELE